MYCKYFKHEIHFCKLKNEYVEENCFVDCCYMKSGTDKFHDKAFLKLAIRFYKDI